MAYLTVRRGARSGAIAQLLILALGCALLLAPAARAAEEPPTIAPFVTAHVRVEGTISAQGQDRPVQGEGDVDAARGASRLTVTLLNSTTETIAIDGRIYRRDLLTGRWEYNTAAGGFDPVRLAIYDPATIRAAGRDFVNVGSETIDGEATTHWRANVDLAALLGGVPGVDGGTARLTSTTLNFWLGQGDSRLRRLTLEAQGTATSGAATNAYRLALTVSYGKFDTDVAIIAPSGATPATPSPAVAATPAVGAAAGSSAGPVATLTPLGEATSRVGVLSAPHVLRFFAIVSLAVIGGVVVLATVRGGKRRATAPAPRRRR